MFSNSNWDRNFQVEKYSGSIARIYPLLILASIGYYVAIKCGQRYMSTRKPMDVKLWLMIWNLLLTIFSIRGTQVLWQEVVAATYLAEDILSSFCVPHVLTEYGGAWFAMFVTSKLFEFIDTMFLVMRKKPVIFLHWYHHISVMLLSFHLWTTLHPNSRYFAFVNFLVHSIMYGYFFISALGIRVNRKIALAITLLQLAQMFFGLFLSYHAVTSCDPSYSRISAYFSFAVYCSYAGLFAHFLVKTYFFKKSHKSVLEKNLINHNNNHIIINHNKIN